MTKPSAQSQTPSRIDAQWLKAPSLLTVFDVLSAAGCEGRIVGGAVRNTIAGRPVVDIDIATPCEPDLVARLAKAAGLDCHATGLSHGTVTIVSDGTPYQVTTLRRDVETDGRHAVVAFTTNWLEDAQRRDLTINALYCDRDGNIFDPVGGLHDLVQRHVRFIGDAATRICEDYLRILRFFRFSAEYAEGAFDAEGVAACSALKDGLARLSAERVWAELKKLLVAPRAADAARIMQEHGLFARLLGTTTDLEAFERLAQIEKVLDAPANPVTRLAALTASDRGQAPSVAQRLRLSRAEADALQNALLTDPGFDPSSPDRDARVAVYRLGKAAFADAQRLAWARSDALVADPSWSSRAALAASWAPPALPYSGADIIALGVPAGPAVSAALRAFEAWWIAADFPADRVLLENKLAAVAAEAKAAR